jgi:hypothetical protein
MATTTTASELVVTKYLSDFFREYIRNNRFSRYTGTSMNNVITIKEGRKKIEVPLVTRLKGAGVSCNNTLRGNGEAIGNYGHELAPTYYRHAVEFTREELEKPNIDLMRAARPLLMDWAMEKTRDDVIRAMAAMHDGTAYREIATVTEAQADLWAAQNDDRILFGSVKSNASGDHSADLAKIDTTNDKLDADIVSLAKRMAKTADPHIRPIRTSEDEEWYVMFADPFAFRDLKSNLGTSHQNAMPRSRTKNPIWTDGDLVYDGVIIREIPEIDALVTLTDGTSSVINLLTGGDTSSRVAPCFLCGAQALGFGLGQRPQIKVDRDYDYGFQPGVAAELKHDIDKLFFDNNPSGTSSQHVQHGMVTVYVSAAVDS